MFWSWVTTIFVGFVGFFWKEMETRRRRKIEKVEFQTPPPKKKRSEQEEEESVSPYFATKEKKTRRKRSTTRTAIDTEVSRVENEQKSIVTVGGAKRQLKRQMEQDSDQKFIGKTAAANRIKDPNEETSNRNKTTSQVPGKKPTAKKTTSQDNKEKKVVQKVEKARKKKESKVSKVKNRKGQSVKIEEGNTKMAEESDDSEEEEEEWEEVQHVSQGNVRDEPSTSSQPLEITLNAPKKKAQVDMLTLIRRRIDRFKRHQRQLLHKVHLLTYFAHGRRLSSACNDTLVKSVALSLLPVGFASSSSSAAETFGVVELKRLASFVKSAFPIKSDQFETIGTNWEELIVSNLESKSADNFKLLALIFVSIVRSIGLDARIVISADPRPLTGIEEDKSTTTTIEGKTDSKKETSKNIKSKIDTASKETLVSETKSAKSKNGDSKEKKNNKNEKVQVDTCKKSTTQKSKVLVVDIWAEVYLSSVERWICVNCVKGIVDDPASIESQCSKSLSYVLSFDSENSIRDVTQRYSSIFGSSAFRKCRLKDDWFEQTLKKFRQTSQIRQRLEDMEMGSKLTEMPMPKSVAEFKDHPVYVLKRHLLKFQGIYPVDTKPVGFIRSEPIYPRSCVHMLHSRETWRKEALMVRDGEEPVKIVKARPKSNVPKEQQVERPLPLFGIWQTDPYISPPAADGIVPRNQYGNVELFKPSMLPSGTVHLHHPGLLQVAKKLNVDCVPAMTGWDFHAGGSHPVLDGWVVCEEHEEILIAAWDQEQAIIAQRDAERKSKRALINWKKLIKGLLIREKIRKKFNINDDDDERASTSTTTARDSSSINTKKKTTSEEEEKPNIENSWPQCRMNFT